MWLDYDKAIAIVRYCLTLDYDKWTWDDMVGRPGSSPFGCVLQCVKTQLPSSRWLEAGFYIGRELRRRYSFKRKAWSTHNWAGEVTQILNTIAANVIDCERRPPSPVDDNNPSSMNLAAPLSNGFVQWKLFRQRSPAPAESGIYLFSYYDDMPEAEVCPLNRNVIYIGYSGHPKNRRTIANRLDEFEQTALGKIGHSTGWTYRTEFVKDWSSLLVFHNTYVSWKTYSRDSEHPRTLEKSLIADYLSQWGERPFLNRAS